MSTDTTSRKPIVNFSRPRLNSSATSDGNPDTRPRTPAQVHSVNAFHEDSHQSQDNDDEPFPDEPRFSLDSTTAASTPRGPQLSAHEQRYPHHPRTPSSSNTATTSSSRPPTSTTTSESVKQLMPKSILKHTTVEQYSERADSEAGESEGSHHTASEAGSFDRDGKWTSSEFDTSMLSEKEIRKLEKKGVNPSLYAEMKMARKGKSCVGGLTGNAYVS